MSLLIIFLLSNSNNMFKNYDIKYVGDNFNPNSINAQSSLQMNSSNQLSDTQLSIKQEPDMSYTEYESYISISSSNRDSINYPLHYDYRINLDFPYKNIKKIELISAILPNQAASSSDGNILNEPYLTIDIDELNFIEYPNNVGSSALKGFAILPLKPSTQTSGGFINPEMNVTYHKSKVYKTPLSSLSNFSIKIRNSVGELYDFGVLGGSTDKIYQNHFVFKITTQEVDRKILNIRNVY